MSPLADVRTRVHALRVFLLSSRLDAAHASPASTLDEPEVQRLARAQRRSLRSLYETARALPPSHPMRRAAERAFDAGWTRLDSDPASETHALAAHDYELALAELRACIRLRPILRSSRAS